MPQITRGKRVGAKKSSAGTEVAQVRVREIESGLENGLATCVNVALKSPELEGQFREIRVYVGHQTPQIQLSKYPPGDSHHLNLGLKSRGSRVEPYGSCDIFLSFSTICIRHLRHVIRICTCAKMLHVTSIALLFIVYIEVASLFLSQTRIC